MIPPIRFPFTVPPTDPTTGLISRPWLLALNQINQALALVVEGPAGSVTTGAAVKFDGTSGRLVKE